MCHTFHCANNVLCLNEVVLVPCYIDTLHTSKSGSTGAQQANVNAMHRWSMLKLSFSLTLLVKLELISFLYLGDTGSHHYISHL